MARADREIDKTHLSIDQAEARGFLHRDYIAHCLRWTYICRYLMQKHRYKTARILDVGCGREVPLAKLLHSSRMAPVEGWYVGVDYNKLEMPEQFSNAAWKPILSGQVDASDLSQIQVALGSNVPNLIVSLEVLEHVTPAKCLLILEHFYRFVNDGAEAIISTPCWDSHIGAADNHINEMKFKVLGAVLEDLGFAVHQVYGTFASQRDLKPRLKDTKLEELFDKFGEYYDSNYLATIFAPLWPDLSRNCLWHLRKQGDGYGRRFPRMEEIAKVEAPWTSSPKWQELAPWASLKI